MEIKGTAKLNYYKNNCEEELIKTPISVLRYIGILETHIEELKAPEMLEMLKDQLEFLIYCRDNMKVSRPVFNQKIVIIQQLIKEATEINP